MEEGDCGGEKGKEFPSLPSYPIPPLLFFSPSPSFLFPSLALATQANTLTNTKSVTEMKPVDYYDRRQKTGLKFQHLRSSI